MSTSMDEQLLEQQMHVHQCKSTTTDQAPQLDVKLDSLQVMRTCFSWKEGFLTAHKPPTCQPILMSTQQCCHPSGHQGPNNTPRALPAVSSPLDTMAKTSVPGSFLQWYDVCLNLHGPNGTTYSEWEGITNLFLWMQEIDKTIELLPWAVQDQQTIIRQLS